MTALQLSDRLDSAQLRGKLAAVEQERASRTQRFRAGARVVVDVLPRSMEGVVVECYRHSSAGTVVVVDLSDGTRRRLVAGRFKLASTRKKGGRS